MRRSPKVQPAAEQDLVCFCVNWLNYVRFFCKPAWGVFVYWRAPPFDCFLFASYVLCVTAFHHEAHVDQQACAIYAFCEIARSATVTAVEHDLKSSNEAARLMVVSAKSVLCRGLKLKFGKVGMLLFLKTVFHLSVFFALLSMLVRRLLAPIFIKLFLKIQNLQISLNIVLAP